MKQSEHLWKSFEEHNDAEADRAEDHHTLLAKSSWDKKETSLLHHQSKKRLHYALDVLVILCLVGTVGFFAIRDATHKRNCNQNHVPDLPAGSDYGKFVLPGEMICSCSCSDNV